MVIMVAYPLDRRGRPIPDGSWPGRRAPDGLETLRRFLNTTNHENGAELLDGPGDAEDWLAGEGHRIDGALSASDVALLVDTRRALRALAGEPAVIDVAASLRRIAEHCPVVVHLSPFATLEPMYPGAPAFVSRLLAIAHDAIVDATWPRLKPCLHCRWFFYDHSRNAAGRWCSTQACGGRLKARAYRARKKVTHA
jgi:hypothetical protein